MKKILLFWAFVLIAIGSGTAFAQRDLYRDLHKPITKDLARSFSTPVRVIATNGNFVPFQMDSSTNFVRNNFHRKYIAGNKNITDIKATVANFAATSTGELSTSQTMDYKVSMYYNGSVFPCNVGGNVTVSIAAGNTAEFSCPNLILQPAVSRELYVAMRAVGTAGTFNYPRSTVSWSLFGEGAALGVDTAVDFTDGTLAWGAEATPTVSGGNITAGTVTRGGQNYTTSATVYAYEWSNNVLYVKSVGTGTASGGAITSISISSGTPPAGLAAWVSPTLTVKYGSATLTSANAIAGYTTSLITGTVMGPVPSAGVLLVGDSIPRGNGQALPPDEKMNQGIYEMCVNNSVGIFNAAIGSGTASVFQNWSGNYPKLFAMMAAAPVDDVLLPLGTNDIRNGTTLATLRTNYNTVKTKLREYGEVKTATVLSRSTNSAPYTTPITLDFANGAMYDQFNTEIRNGTINNDGGFLDAQLMLSNSGNREQWIQTAGVVTNDGTHPRATAYGLARFDSSYQAQCNFLR